MKELWNRFWTRGKGLPSVVAAAVLVACVIAVMRMPPDDRSYQNVGQIIELGLLSVGLLSLVLIARQTRTTAKWNKLLSYHQFFGELISPATLVQMTGAAEACGFSEQMLKISPMTDDSVNKVLASPDHDQTVSTYLDEFEEFCAAVHAGIVDNEYAYTLEATRVIRAWVVFEPFITQCRSKTKYSRCYIELQRLGVAWKGRREKEEARNHATDGVRPHV